MHRCKMVNFECSHFLCYFAPLEAGFKGFNLLIHLSPSPVFQTSTFICYPSLLNSVVLHFSLPQPQSLLPDLASQDSKFYLDISIIIENTMFAPQREICEYHLNILSVKMKVKFPCRMKIEHLGSLITGESPPSDDNRYIFNQEIILKDQTQTDCFELTINLLTDKGAKYTAGSIKLYKAELIRSEGERLVLSLSKCIDSEAFCEVKVDQVIGVKTNKNVPYDRKSTLQREVTYRRETPDIDLSPYRNNPTKILQSKSEYQFPLHQNGGLRQHDWDTKSKSRMLPPQTVYQKSKLAPRVNYAIQPHPYNGFDLGESNVIGREKALQAQVYKQGYQKLKEKYKKQAENSKQELNKRLALENTQNNLKLEIMRLKMKVQQLQKSSNDKNSKIKDYQNQVNLLQQKEIDNGYLREEVNKKDSIIKSLEDKIRNLNRNIEELRELATDRTNQQGNRIKQLQLEMESLRIKLESKERQFEKEIKGKAELLHAKEIELITKRDGLERQRKTVADLQRALQNKNYEVEKLTQNERNNSKSKIDEYKTKTEKIEREFLKIEEEKKDQNREIEQLRSTLIKLEYDKKILIQEQESIRVEYAECKVFREKYNQAARDNKSLNEEKLHLERQLERTIQSKEFNLSQINKQYQDQVEYYKKINRELDEKNKNISNKLIEVEGHFELSRNQQDKLRRNLEASIKEAADAKEKEKTVKKALKSKEQESLSFQSEHATLKQKLKSIEQIYKLEVDKVRDDAEKLRIQYENQLDRVEQMSESSNQLNMEVNRLKIRLQYSQEKNEKDAANIKEKQHHIQTLVKDYEQQVTTLDQNINNLRLSQKQQSTKIQRYQIESIKAEQKIEKSKKDIKILEERCTNYENTVKNKSNQNQTLLAERDTLSRKLQQSQNESTSLKAEVANLTNQKGKLTKMNELLQQEIKKIKIDINNSSLFISDKEKSEEQLRNQIKFEKEEFSKLDLKFNTYKKQTERYRQTLNETIQKYIFTLPILQKQEGKKTFQDLFTKKSSENTFNDLINLIINQSKEVKQALTKQTEQLKVLQRENQRAHEEASHSSNKYQTSESTLKKQLEELQKQLAHVLEQKEIESSNYSNIIAELDERVKSLELMEEELNTQIEELNFTINSLKMDYDAMNDQNTKKIITLRKLNNQLEEKIEYQLMTITELDERCSAMEGDIDNLQAAIENETDASHKKDKNIQELKEIKESQEISLEEFKKQRKDLAQKVAQLELHLNTEKEYKDKTKTMLEEQESKANELKTFISNLMKQKEAAIKSELQRSEKLIEFQSLLHEVNKQLQLLKQQNERNIKTLEQQKEQNRKLNLSIKDLQNEKKEEKVKATKVQQKLRERQKEILNKDESSKKNEVRYEKALEKAKSEIKELQKELQFKNNTNIQASKDSNERIISLENQIQRKTSQISSLQAKLSEIQQQVYAERQKVLTFDEQTIKLKNQNQQLKMKISQMDINLNDIADESKEKQEKLFEFSGKIYTLQLKLESKQHESEEKLENLDQQWANKYDSMCEEYEQRMELIEKERDYFKSLSDEKDKEISKLTLVLKTAQNNENSMRKSFEQKTRKLEEEKLSLFTLKSNEIQRLVEEAKILADNLKQRETELRRLTNELEVARKTITNLDSKSKEYDEKIKGINKVYQTELQQLKKKDASFKAYRESVNTHQWNIEREIKRVLQNFIKNFLEISDDKNSSKLVELVRGLEKGLMQILSVKPSEK